MRLELTKAISSHRNLPDLFHDLAGHLHNLFDFQYLHLWLYDESRNALRLHILETTEPVDQNIPDEVPVEGSLCGWAWQNREPLVIRDLEKESRFPKEQILQNHPAKSVCSLPLTTAHRRLGVLSMASNKMDAYDRLDLEFAQLVAAQIAVAVDNAFNFQETQSYQQELMRERDRLRLLLDVNNILVSTLDLRELLEAISAEPGSRVKVKLAAVAFIDSKGRELLTRMHCQGVTLVPTGCLMRAIVEEIEDEVGKRNPLQHL